MFTGIVEEIGTLKSINSSTIIVECRTVLENTKLGDSIAINGCCQTVVDITNNTFTANVSQETFKVTNFAKMKVGDKVNLERALTPSSRMGGHIVQGHVDGIAIFCRKEQLNEFYNLYFEVTEELQKYIVKKGSITVNGVSLTVAELNNNIIKIAVIPHTFENTNLKHLQIRDNVNIETDILSKYVEKFLIKHDNKINENFLIENGFM